VDVQPRSSAGEVWFELTLTDAWVWDMYRPARFVKSVRVLTFKDVNVEKLEKPDLDLPGVARRSAGSACSCGSLGSVTSRPVTRKLAAQPASRRTAPATDR
jgi:hypothetical protein